MEVNLINCYNISECKNVEDILKTYNYMLSISEIKDINKTNINNKEEKVKTI